MAARLETFRTQTLPSFEPAEKKDGEMAEMASYMDSLIGSESFQIPLVPTVNSRAGLYIYLNAAVGLSRSEAMWVGTDGDDSSWAGHS